MKAYMIPGSCDKNIVDQIKGEQKPLSLEEYFKEACKVLGIEEGEVKKHTRSQVVLFPRVAIARGMRRKCTLATLVEIGEFLGKDHSTIIYYKKKIKEHSVWVQYEKILIKSGL